MNFFEHQAKAKSLSTRLIVLLVLAVMVVVFTTNMLVLFAFGYWHSNAPSFSAYNATVANSTYALISIVVLLQIGVATYRKSKFLKAGGRAIALSMGGELLTFQTDNLRERQLLNIVEEMSIASGVPVPQVFLLRQEQGINAFAAGLSLSDAVVGITKGALEYLDREELQGVVAHEFSHILNGDMTLNMRLTGLVAGIQSIGQVGYDMLVPDQKDNRGTALPFLYIFAIGLILIGAVGTFAGNIIKASVSRQREYLADASAVQFTRNNRGIAGALKKIGGFKAGSKIRNTHAREFSHGLFSDGIYSYLFSILSTHPSLTKRIKALEPFWFPRFKEVLHRSNVDTNLAFGFAPKVSTKQSQLSPQHTSVKPLVIDTIGQIKQENLKAAKDIVASLPFNIVQSMHTTKGAQTILFALFIDDATLSTNNRDSQKNYLNEVLAPDLYKSVISMATELQDIGIHTRLPLIEVCLPQLKILSVDDLHNMLIYINEVSRLCVTKALWSWSGAIIIETYIERELACFDNRHKPVSSIKSIHTVHANIEAIMTVILKHYVQPSEQLAVINGAKSIIGIDDLEMHTNIIDDVTRFTRALKPIQRLTPRLKQRFVQFIVYLVTQDNDYSIQEQETIRAICEVIDIPVPIK